MAILNFGDFSIVSNISHNMCSLLDYFPYYYLQCPFLNTLQQTFPYDLLADFMENTHIGQQIVHHLQFPSL